MTASNLPAAIIELLAAANELPSGSVRIDALQRAVDVADTLRDISAGFYTRRQLIDEADYCLRYDLYATSFSWCLAMAREHPTKFSLIDLLGHYRNLIGKVVNFPNVSREQYETMFEDVVHEYQTHGFSLRTAFIERRAVAADFGDREMALAADREWRLHRRDELSQSMDREDIWHIEHELFMGNDQATVHRSDEYFARTNRYLPSDSWVAGLVLLPLLRLGRKMDAEALYQLTTTRSHHTGFIWSRGYHLEYLGRIGDFKRGLSELKAQLPLALAQPDPSSRYYCLRPAVSLLDRIAATGKRKIALKVPQDVPWSDTRDISELREWVHNEAASIAQQFDKRNGNSYYSEWLRLTIDLQDRRPGSLITA